MKADICPYVPTYSALVVPFLLSAGPSSTLSPISLFRRAGARGGFVVWSTLGELLCHLGFTLRLLFSNTLD